jgi:hypothetical protein
VSTILTAITQPKIENERQTAQLCVLYDASNRLGSIW